MPPRSYCWPKGCCHTLLNWSYMRAICSEQSDNTTPPVDDSLESSSNQSIDSLASTPQASLAAASEALGASSQNIINTGSAMVSALGPLSQTNCICCSGKGCDNCLSTPVAHCWALFLRRSAAAVTADAPKLLNRARDQSLNQQTQRNIISTESIDQQVCACHRAHRVYDWWSQAGERRG